MKRISGYVTEELYLEIEEISKKENRKITPMISILLQLAVKQKNRKRNGRQENNTEHNAPNLG